jgi:cell division protein FtsN
MLPLLLASTLGIVIFSFNIFFVNNKDNLISYDLSREQNRNVRADANANLNSAASAADFVSPSINDKARTDVKKTSNVGTPAPVGINQAPRTLAKKTAPVSNPPPNAKTQSWQIQAGAFSVETSAAKIKDKIIPLGYNVEIIKAGTEKPLFKVMVSVGKSGATPNDALNKIKSIGIDGYIVGAGRS